MAARPTTPNARLTNGACKGAMTLASRLIGVQDLQPGDTVGYGSSFRADAPMRIGIVACGYADGYPRHCTTGTPVLVDGVRTRLVGRVSMDMLTVDLSPVPQAGMGSEVTLWGRRPAVPCCPLTRWRRLQAPWAMS
jgi:alanine racemase